MSSDTAQIAHEEQRIDPGAPLGELVTALPGSARTFERHGLDYCCGGRVPLDEAAATAGIDIEEVLEELRTLPDEPTPEWASLDASELVDHIEATHHVYLRGEMPRLGQLAAKVASVHGDRHPELLQVARTFSALCDELWPHLVKEERVLFPAVRELAGATETPWFPFGPTSGPISILLTEHDSAGEMLEKLRDLTGGYQAPEDACASYTALYQGLEEFEADMHLHVHKENNVLFPAVAELESRLSAPAPSERAPG